MEFKSILSGIRIEDKKSDEQLSTVNDITKFCILLEEVIKFFDDYCNVILQAAYDAKHGKGLKTLTSK